ncbi:LysR family transcriptional regulator [Exilibacterium tricleocarpae]|uniref:LysR family transcriptional regulator n=1 Tax=Exilibacterium tricleocarpae TaxID=2591008 RepID=A0A545SYX5_9GAMM|nr:LysR family transcriptional regulator [Exilibacterium tricleocarpae]TQV70167.1 LysR family transcriptional regulator [Exilibacterium tricleocarpae]
MHFTLRQLQIFLAAADHENITRAAQSLAMSQSAASSALKELEQQFDIQLFDRVGKRLQLNELGRLMRPRAEALLARAAELEAALARHADAGPIKVGATMSIGNYLAVGIMAGYMARYPDAKVELAVANTESIVAKVANFELDLGLIEGEFQHPELEVIPWRDDELVVFSAPSHPLAQQPALADTDLLAVKWILREHGSGTRQTFDRAMHDLLPNMHLLLELQHTEAIKRAVEAGLGVGCISRITLEVAFARRTLVPLNVPGRDLRRRFYFILHKQKYRSAGIDHWLRLCREMTPADKLIDDPRCAR